MSAPLPPDPTFNADACVRPPRRLYLCLPFPGTKAALKLVELLQSVIDDALMAGVVAADAELKEDHDEGTGAANAENEKNHDGKADVVKKHVRLDDKWSAAIKVRSCGLVRCAPEHVITTCSSSSCSK